MRRHKRDVHGVITGSTSPPTKKKKIQMVKDDECESMDFANDGNISDLSSQMEDMDIDDMESENSVDDRTNKMDEKVKEKQERSNAEELSREQIKRQIEIKRKAEMQDNLDKRRKKNKMIKQKSK